MAAAGQPSIRLTLSLLSAWPLGTSDPLRDFVANPSSVPGGVELVRRRDLLNRVTMVAYSHAKGKVVKRCVRGGALPPKLLVAPCAHRRRP